MKASKKSKTSGGRMGLQCFVFLTVAMGACRPQATLTYTDNGWTPPTKTAIPAAFVTATKTLLGNGLCDARGGEFHKVTVMLGNAAGYGQKSLFEKEGYGWIMPDKQVVLIDGLKYPVKNDLGPAKPDDLYPANPNVIGGFTRDGIEISHPTITMTALLLVRGETEKAEKFFGVTGKHSVDPVLNLYAELTYRYTMQVGQCLMDRNDKDALPWAKSLATVSNLREKAGVNYGKDTAGWRFEPETANQILNDIVRRTQNPKPHIDLAQNAKLSPNVRIANLVDALDDVASRQWGQPGGISWMEDPIMSSLAKEGEVAIPALIDCIESDDRMTRSVSYGRDFFPSRTIHPVRTAAWYCLQSIWPAVATLQYEDNPKAKIAKLREMWKADSALSEPERWLRVLRVDSDEIGNRGIGDNWILAAQHITDPMHIIRNGQHGMSILPQKSKVMHGESLRAQHGAEVTALLTKRIESLTKVEETRSSMQFFQFGNGLTIAHCLSKWDQKASIPVLQQACARTLKMVGQWQKSLGELHSSVVGPFGRVIADRANAGDATAAKDYAAMMPYMKLSGFDVKSTLLPLWRSPNNVAVQAVGAKALTEILAEQSKPTKPDGSGNIYAVEDLLRGEMILSPAFRAFLIDACILTKELGRATVKASQTKGYVEVQYRSASGGGSYQFQTADDVTPYLGDNVLITAGDWVAQQISGKKGAPAFLVSWPAEKKVAAKQEIARWLKDQRVNWDQVARSSPFANLDFD